MARNQTDIAAATRGGALKPHIPKELNADPVVYRKKKKQVFTGTAAASYVDPTAVADYDEVAPKSLARKDPSFFEGISSEYHEDEEFGVLGQDKNYASDEYAKVVPEARAAQQIIGLGPQVSTAFMNIYEDTKGLNQAPSPTARRALQAISKSGLDFDKIAGYVKQSMRHRIYMSDEISNDPDFNKVHEDNDGFMDAITDSTDKARSPREAKAKALHMIRWMGKEDADVLSDDPLSRYDAGIHASKVEAAALSIVGQFLDPASFNGMSPKSKAEIYKAASGVVMEHGPRMLAGRSFAMANISNQDYTTEQSIAAKANVNRDMFDELYTKLSSHTRLSKHIKMGVYDDLDDKAMASYKGGVKELRNLTKNPELGYLSKSRENFQNPAYFRDALASMGYDTTSVSEIAESGEMSFTSTGQEISEQALGYLQAGMNPKIALQMALEDYNEGGGPVIGARDLILGTKTQDALDKWDEAVAEGKGGMAPYVMPPAVVYEKPFDQTGVEGWDWTKKHYQGSLPVGPMPQVDDSNLTAPKAPAPAPISQAFTPRFNPYQQMPTGSFTAPNQPFNLGGSTGPVNQSPPTNNAFAGGTHTSSSDAAMANFFAANPHLVQGPTDDDKHQAGSEWREARHALFTSSGISDLGDTETSKKKPVSGRQSLLRKMMGEATSEFDATTTPPEGNKYTRSGDALEDVVGEHLKKKYGGAIFSPGLITDPAKPGHGTTVDFMTETGIHEVKSRQRFLNANDPTLTPRERETLESNYAQIQHQMWMTGVKEAYLHEIIRDPRDPMQPLGLDGLKEGINYRAQKYKLDEEFVARNEEMWRAVGKTTAQINELSPEVQRQFAHAVKQGNLASFEELAEKHGIEGAGAYAKHMGLGEGNRNTGEEFADNLVAALERKGGGGGRGGSGGGLFGLLGNAIPNTPFGKMLSAGLGIGSMLFDTAAQANEVSLQQDASSRAAGFRDSSLFREAKSGLRSDLMLGGEEAEKSIQAIALAKGGLAVGDPKAAINMVAATRGAITLQDFEKLNLSDPDAVSSFFSDARQKLLDRGLAPEEIAAIAAQHPGLSALTAKPPTEGEQKLNTIFADLEEFAGDAWTFGASFLGHTLSSGGLDIPSAISQAIRDTTGADEPIPPKPNPNVPKAKKASAQVKNGGDDTDGVAEPEKGWNQEVIEESKKAEEAEKAKEEEYQAWRHWDTKDEIKFAQQETVARVMSSMGYKLGSVSEEQFAKGHAIAKKWTPEQMGMLQSYLDKNPEALKGQGAATIVDVRLTADGVTITNEKGDHTTTYKPVSTKGKK